MRLLGVALLVAAVVSAGPVSDSDLLTGTFLNGRGWRTMSEKDKFVYLFGLTDGMGIGDLACKDATLRKIYLARASADETVKALDRFYDEPANGSVMVWDAMRVFRLKVDGRPQSEIVEATEAGRRLARKLIEGPPKSQ